MRATAAYAITRWDEYTELRAEHPKLSKVSTSSTYTGELDGTATSETVMTYLTADTADYTGYERFTGTLSGRTGTVVLRVEGTYANGTANTTVTIVAGTGTGELTGLTGTGSYVATHGEPTLTLTLDHEFA